MPAPEPDDLRSLGARLDAVQRKRASGQKQAPPTSLGIAFRFTTEMVAALIVGGAVGWGIDWLAGTRPIFLVVFFVLGAAAGIRNVVRAAAELNAQMANKPGADDKES
ncbi:MAG TPA: AtpZ/AtpI family protein [Rhizomicrobium sp.]|jgi:ATP synthase protein I|nr:AtpZ/AtpI family protein [Rhizomicrobium sp.]HEX4533043.1 AtpZ/AtpI family protein [Rhizomicrobium sp.]